MKLYSVNFEFGTQLIFLALTLFNTLYKVNFIFYDHSFLIFCNLGSYKGGSVDAVVHREIFYEKIQVIL